MNSNVTIIRWDAECRYCARYQRACGRPHATGQVEKDPARCELHPVYESDYCPICGTARTIGA